MYSNIGHAVLILGTLYFGYNFGFEWWHYLLILFAILTWTVPELTKRGREHKDAKTELLRAKTEYYRKRLEFIPKGEVK